MPMTQEAATQPMHLGPLAVWRHQPKKTAVARILLVHGICEHSGRHKNTIDFLVEQGFEVIRFDLRGMGSSGGKRQWVKHFEDYVEDVAQVTAWIGTLNDSLPLFALGHSLGGQICLFFAASYQKLLNGMILSAPAFRVGSGISPIKIFLGKMVAGILPELKIPDNVEHTSISRDPEVVRAYDTDPLACHFNTVQQGTEVLNALERIPQICGQIKIPVFIAHGTSDVTILPTGSFEIINHLKSESKELHFMPGCYHELHNDYGKEEYFQRILYWLHRQLELRTTDSAEKPISAGKKSKKQREPQVATPGT